MSSTKSSKQKAEEMSCKNTTEVCRICLRSCEDFLNIYGNKVHIDNKVLKDCLEEICDISICPEDHHLPQFICSNCTESLEQCYNFLMLVKKNDEYLHRAYSSDCIEIEEGKIYDNRIGEGLEYIKCTPPFIDNCQITNINIKNYSKESQNDSILQTILQRPLQDKDFSESIPNIIKEIEYEDQVDKSTNCLIKEEFCIDENDLKCEETLENIETTYRPEQGTTIEQQQQAIEKKFKCKFCGQKFLYFNNKEQHEKRHKKAGNLKCNLCERIFFSIYNLNRHSYTHKNKKNFQCLRCEKSYRQLNTLNQHINFIHLNQKEHKCRICGKFFVTPSKVKAHQKSKKCSQKISVKIQNIKHKIVAISDEEEVLMEEEEKDSKCIVEKNEKMNIDMKKSEENTADNVWFTLTVMQ